MKLTVIGCSPAWPNPGSAHAGFLLEGGSSGSAATVLLDCGPGVLDRLRQRDGWPTVDAIVLTHFHLDHWGDLIPWVWGARYLTSRGESPRRPDLWVPPGGVATLDDFAVRLGHPGMFASAFEISEYRPGEPFDVAGYEVTALQVPHYGVEAHGLRVSAGGRTLAYSGDSAPDERLDRLARDADLFLCEATLASGAEDGALRGHLSLDEAVAAFRASGARRLLVVHRPAELPPTPGVELAHDGMVLEV